MEEMEEYEIDFEEEEDNDFLDVDVCGLMKGSEEDLDLEEFSQRDVTPVRTFEEDEKSPLKKVLDICKNVERQTETLATQMRDLKRQMKTVQGGFCLKQGDEDNEEEGMKDEDTSIWFLWSKQRKAKKQRQELIELLESTAFDAEQMEQICAGIEEGLSIKEIRGYARKELSAKNMEAVRGIYRKIKEVD